MNIQTSTPTTKRKKDEVSPNTSTSSDSIDLKRAKQLLSISDSETELSPKAMSKENASPDNSKEVSDEMAKVQTPSKDLFSELDKKLESKLTLIKEEIISEIKDAFKGSIDRLESDVMGLKLENEKLKKEVSVLKDGQKSSTDSIKKLEGKIQSLEEAAVKNEQYSRRKNIRIIGLYEADDEDTAHVVAQFIYKKMKVEVNTLAENTIEIAHRLGDKGSRDKFVSGARPVIVKFSSVEMKIKVLKARSTLKGVGIYVNEDLCRGIQQLYNRVRKSRDIDQAWTWNGAVFGKDDEGTVHKFAYGKTVKETLEADADMTSY